MMSEWVLHCPTMVQAEKGWRWVELEMLSVWCLEADWMHMVTQPGLQALGTGHWGVPQAANQL